MPPFKGILDYSGDWIGINRIHQEQPILTIHSAGNHATEIEKNINRKKKTLPNHTYNKTNRTYNPKRTNTFTTPRRNNPNNAQKDNDTKQGAPLKDPKDIICFKCNGRGHYKVNCPNARAFTMREWNDIRQDTRPKVILVPRMGGRKRYGHQLLSRTLMVPMQ